MSIEKINKSFYLPRWNEFPNVDLYIDQVVCLLEKYLSDYIISDTDKEDKIITIGIILLPFYLILRLY